MGFVWTLAIILNEFQSTTQILPFNHPTLAQWSYLLILSPSEPGETKAQDQADSKWSRLGLAQVFWFITSLKQAKLYLPINPRVVTAHLLWALAPGGFQRSVDHGEDPDFPECQLPEVIE